MKEAFYSESARVMRPSAIREMSKRTEKPGIISFAPGQPSGETFPAAEMAEIAARLLRDEPATSLQYTVTRGFHPLLEVVAGLLE